MTHPLQHNSHKYGKVPLLSIKYSNSGHLGVRIQSYLIFLFRLVWCVGVSGVWIVSGTGCIMLDNTWRTATCKGTKSSLHCLPRMSWIYLTHRGQDKTAVIFQTTFSNVFSWMKMYEFLLNLHWSVFQRIQLIISQHWFRWWLGVRQATSHYRNQCWLVYWCIYVSLGLNMFAFSVISRHWNARGCWDSLSWKTILWSFYSQYHGCWWPGNARKQDISRHAIDFILSEYFSLSTTSIKK